MWPAGGRLATRWDDRSRSRWEAPFAFLRDERAAQPASVGVKSLG
jgi:hypothetical protein